MSGGNVLDPSESRPIDSSFSNRVAFTDIKNRKGHSSAQFCQYYQHSPKCHIAVFLEIVIRLNFSFKALMKNAFVLFSTRPRLLLFYSPPTVKLQSSGNLQLQSREMTQNRIFLNLNHNNYLSE